MTKKELMNMVKALGDAAEVHYNKRRDIITITLEDFIGFTEDYEEIYNEEMEEKFDDFIDTLKKKAPSHCDSIYGEASYYFDDFEVRVTYTSYDI